MYRRSMRCIPNSPKARNKKKKTQKKIKKKNKKENHTNKIIFDFICIIVMYSVAKSKAEAKTNLLTTN